MAFLSGSVTNILKDWVDRRRLRKALYAEIITMYDALKYVAENLKNDIDNETLTWTGRYTRFRRDYGHLKIDLSADTYKYAKAAPALYRGVKDVESIDKVYFTFALFDSELDVWGINTTLLNNLEHQLGQAKETAPLEEAVWLRKICDAYLNALKMLFKRRTLDKKMLLKAAASVASSKEYWEKLLEEPLPEAKQPKKVEEPAEKEKPEGFWARLWGR